MGIKIIEYSDFQNKNDVVVNVFGSENYFKAAKKNGGVLLGIIGEKVVCALPFVIKRRLSFRYLTFTSSIIYQDTILDFKQEQLFLNEVIKYLNSYNIDFITPGYANAVFKSYPKGSIYAPFGSYIIKLQEANINTIWNNVHSKHKNVIRSAIKNNVLIKWGYEYKKDAFRLISDTRKREGISTIPKSYFDQFIDTLSERGECEIFVSYKEDLIQGCAILLYNKVSVYYLWGGSITKPYSGAINLLHWEAIKYFKEKGVREYNFVGARIKPAKDSKYTGIQRFKSRFGGELVRGYTWKYIYKRFKYNIYQIALSKVTKGKGDVIDQEKYLNTKLSITIDYELFFGKRSGSVKASIINPVNTLIKVFKKNNIKATFFIDTIFIIRLLNENEETKREANLIISQLKTLVQNGHRLELHLHPHWLDAIYDLNERQWRFPTYKKYTLKYLEKNEIDSVVKEGVSLLNTTARAVDKGYSVCAFRAGGWEINSFFKISKTLTRFGIYIDSSVNYSSINNKSFYKFNENPKVEEDGGLFFEVPLTHFRSNIFNALYFSIHRQRNKEIYKPMGDGLGMVKEASKIKYRRRLNQLLRFKMYLPYGMEYIPSNSLSKILEKEKKDFVNLVLHPKTLSQNVLLSFEIISKYEFVTLKEYIDSFREEYKRSL